MIAVIRSLVALGLAAFTAASLHAQTQVTFSIAGTAASAVGSGYTAGDAVTFTFVLKTSGAPTGGFNSPYIFWISDSSHPLFSAVTGTGLTGTWNGLDGLGHATDDEIIINTNFNSLTFLSASDDGIGLSAPNGNHAVLISLLAQWSGLSLPNSSISDPVAYFAARAGSYGFVGGSDNATLSVAGSSGFNFLPSSLTIAQSPIPEPATDAVLAGLDCLLVAAFFRRRLRA